MHIIIDNMVVRRALLAEGDVDFSPVREKLFDKALKLVYGGKLLEEYCTNREVRAMVLRLDQSGGARAYDNARVISRTKAIKKSGLCRSNDAHIIALAQESGARLLCSTDKTLHRDFTNRDLISGPRGKVYQGHLHLPMLQRYCDACRRQSTRT